MSGDVQLELWLHEYKMEALAAALEKKSTTVERQMQKSLNQLYESEVPVELQQDIQTRIDAEYAADRAEREAARKLTALRVREDGAESFFQLDGTESILDVAKFLRRYLREEQGQGVAALRQSVFARMEPVTAEQYDRLLALRMEASGKVTGVFDLDFDQREVSTVDADGWKTWSMYDVSAAIYHAYRKSSLRPERYMDRFLEKLNGKELTSAGHLSARDISFSEEITEINGLLNFYLKTDFDVDGVFGTHVCTAENDDWLNVYANYDMAAGEVCDELEVDLHWVDGREEAVSYTLNAAEKEMLRWKMDEYCQEQTGQSLEEFSAQMLAEEQEPELPSGPMM